MGKPFKETGFGKFLNRVKDIIPDAVDIVDTVITGGKIGDAIDRVKGVLDEKQKYSEAAKLALLELEQKRREWVLEYEKMWLEDKQNARQREVELARSGQRDYMQYAVGLFGLTVFGFMVYFLSFNTPPDDNRELFIHVLGIIEGATISIFSYYFGSSKGSKDKQKILDNSN